MNAQQLLDDYVEWRIKFDNANRDRVPECAEKDGYSKCDCCDFHREALKKAKQLRKDFERVWPKGFQKDFPFEYRTKGFFQLMVKDLNLKVDPDKMGRALGTTSGPWAKETPAQYWNTPAIQKT